MYRRPKPRKKICYFCKNHVDHVDYKDVELLRKYISPSGKITARRITGTCSKPWLSFPTSSTDRKEKKKTRLASAGFFDCLRSLSWDSWKFIYLARKSEGKPPEFILLGFLRRTKCPLLFSSHANKAIQIKALCILCILSLRFVPILSAPMLKM